jgi:hypothetical protein
MTANLRIQATEERGDGWERIEKAKGDLGAGTQFSWRGYWEDELLGQGGWYRDGFGGGDAAGLVRDGCGSRDRSVKDEGWSWVGDVYSWVGPEMQVLGRRYGEVVFGRTYKTVPNSSQVRSVVLRD